MDYPTNQQKSDKDTQKIIKKPQVLFMFFEAGIEFAALIGIPLWVFVYLGKKLDARFNTKYFVLIGIFLALFTTSYAIYKRIKAYKNFIK